MENPFNHPQKTIISLSKYSLYILYTSLHVIYNNYLGLPMHIFRVLLVYPINMGFDVSRDQTPKLKKKFFLCKQSLGSTETTNIEQSISYNIINIYFLRGSSL